MAQSSDDGEVPGQEVAFLSPRGVVDKVMLRGRELVFDLLSQGEKICD
jgi:hypothetical protein